MMRRGFLSAICLGIVVAVMGPAPSAVAAATLTVDTFEDTFDGSCADADCSIRDAVASVDPGGPYGCHRASTRSTVPGPVRTPATSTQPAGHDRGHGRDRNLRRCVRARGSRVRCVIGRLASPSRDARREPGRTRRGSPGHCRHTRRESLHGRRRPSGQRRSRSGGERRHRIDRPVVHLRQRSDPSRRRALHPRNDGRLAIDDLGESRGGRSGAFVGPSASLAIGDATVSRNAAVRGGGVRAIGDIELFFASIVANRAGVGGGVLISPESESSTANSVFARNRASTDRCASGRCLRMDATSPMSEAAVSRRRMT